jgi:hypothetical protein
MFISRSSSQKQSVSSWRSNSVVSGSNCGQKQRGNGKQEHNERLRLCT